MSLSKLNISNIIILCTIHVLGLIGIVYALRGLSSNFAILLGLGLYLYTMLSTTAGLHRLWAHRSYQANFGLRFFLLIGASMSFLGSVIWWVRDHRLHHRTSDTELDPHNSNRGLFYSHIGWLFMKKSVGLVEAGKQIDISDLKKDPLLAFQHKHYLILAVSLGLLVPTVVCWAVNGDILGGFLVAGFARILITFHAVMTINSFAHWKGAKPFNKKIKPIENHFLSVITLGEGYHNFHHQFESDYKASDSLLCINPTAWFIKLCSKIGVATMLIEIPSSRVERLKKKGLAM